MATRNYTIGVGLDYADPELAAAAFVAGTVAGSGGTAVAGDDIVFTEMDGAAYNKRFRITALPVAYNSYKLTADPSIFGLGVYGAGPRLVISTTVDSAFEDGVAGCDGMIEDWEATVSGSGKIAAAVLITAAFDAARTKSVKRCLLHDNGNHSTTPFRTVGVGRISIADGTMLCNVRVLNTLISKWKSGSTVNATGIGTSSSGATVYVDNCTVDDIDVLGGTSGTVRGIVTSNFANKTIKNNVVTKIGTNTTTGTKTCFSGNGGSTVGNDNASDDATAFGTGSLTSIVRGNNLTDPDNGDFRPLNDSAPIFGVGEDLGTTPTGVNIDITGRDRDALGDSWSMGAYQLSSGGSVAPSITITSPVAKRGYKRTSGAATVTVSGAYSGMGTPSDVEVQVDSGSWVVLDANPAGGTYSGTVSVPEGQHTLNVRWSNEVTATASVTSIRVGDVWLVIGQSNTAGRLTNDQVYVNGSFGSSMWKAGAWADLADPSETGGSDGSMLPLLGTLLAAQTGVPQIFLNYAEGGTEISQWWTTSAQAKWTAAKAAVSASGVNGITGVLLDIGESDAINDTTEATFNSRLDGLASDVNSTYGCPLFVAQTGMTTSIDSGDDLDAIRIAQVTAWGDNANVAVGPMQYQRSGLHWTTDAEGAQQTALWWVKIKDKLFSGTNGRGPRISAATTISGTSIVNVTVDQTLLSSDTTYTAAAFSVSHGGTARTVNSVAKTASNTFQLTLSGPLDGATPTVSFAKGNDASNVTYPKGVAISLPSTIHSVSTISQPMEPVYAFAVTVTAPDTTAPVIASATGNAAGNLITVTFTESDSPPLLPSSAATGMTMTSSTGVAVTLANGNRTSDLTFTFVPSRQIYNNETLLISYSQSTGNITDSAVPTMNEVPNTSNFAVTNNSTVSPTITVAAISTPIALVGTASTITWSSAGAGPTVDILLSVDGGASFPITLVAATANDGSFSWTPDSSHVTPTAMIKVRDTANNSYFDDSAAFQVATTDTGVVERTDFFVASGLFIE